MKEYLEHLFEAQNSIERLSEEYGPDAPEVQAKLQEIVDKFGMQEEEQAEQQAQPASTPAGSASVAPASAASVQAPSKAEFAVTGFLGWLSGLWRGPTGDDSAAETKAEAVSNAVAKQQDELQHVEGQWTHVMA
jgi:molybdopterin-biosynthesis enzyme MoeA-like protein